MLGSQLKTVVKTVLSFLGIYEDSLSESGCGKTTVIFNLLLQPGWLDNNHVYVFGKRLHQQEYKVLRKGLDLFNSQEALGNKSPLTAIEKFSGVRNGMIRALGPTQKNLLLLDDCYRTKRCCMMKPRKIGMHSVIRTK